MPKGKPEKFRALATRMRHYLREQKLKQGDRLPSNRRWAEILGVNHLTLRKALQLLENEELIHTLPSRGSYMGQAQSPANKTGLLGFIFPDEEVFFYEILADLERKAEPLGLHPLVHVSHQSEAKEARMIEYFKTMAVTAVVAAPNLQTAHLYQDLRCPVVFFDTLIKTLPIPQVTTDDDKGARRMTEHLIQLGHRAIAHIGGLGEPTSHHRVQGYLNALSSHNIPMEPRPIKRRDYSREWGYEATLALFQDARVKPSALFCGNDTVAVGALHALKSLKLECPREVSVAGFGNTEIASDLDLTTVDQPRSAIVDAVLEKIRALLNDEPTAPVTRIATQPILRGTTAPQGPQSTMRIPRRR